MCGGLWFDIDETDQYFSENDSPEHLIRNRTVSGGILSCPQCSIRMKEVHIHELVLDTCPECRGIWFDGGEVQELKGILDTPAEEKKGLAKRMMEMITRRARIMKMEHISKSDRMEKGRKRGKVYEEDILNREIRKMLKSVSGDVV